MATSDCYLTFGVPEARPAALASLGDYRRIMLESVYLVVLIAAFLAIGAMSLFILYKLFAGQE